ncbi:putative mediator of RNA polymerase II transcription subunit 24 [Microplitis demolitor]|uniref:putative mediator of RNA polymerase II transcription subunit 24 n=1 Tax=Microplitis demolitor TaxID=69319 RepID=UPI0004CD27AE|nr:putative mediator of RNA polymerase II transcription subunit 24 [Microplitis demolitor]XP_008544676.1 putative mediator of RNA polymerase II transcription subunit 24 [Microplitis demolitor]XP_008544677.1 putative mediator of RNA polymerase II transcription subunit 24 [Microplitis demolitor]
MLKHVSISPWRGRCDSVSLASSNGDNSSCGSGSPTPSHTPPPSRASSCASLIPLTALSTFSPADNAPQQTTIKVYANCLRPDIEYKTLSITYETTCHEVVENLLNKYRMRHRDPRLFYMTMEVTVRRANVRTILPLDEDARPAVLQSCHPRGDSRFSLQTRRGGLVKIYDSALMSGSKYKSLLISERTTVDELIQMLLNCYNSTERVEQFSLYEVCEGEEYQRKLHPDDSPLKVTQKWTSIDRHLRIRRNPDYDPHRRKSMWASDSTISAALSRLHLQNKIHLSQQNLSSDKSKTHDNLNNNNNNNNNNTSNNNSSNNSSNNNSNNNSSNSNPSLSASSHCLLLRQRAKCKVNNNNRHNHNHNYPNNVTVSKSNSSMSTSTSTSEECGRNPLTRTTKMSNLLPQSLPSTPLTSKHLGASRFSNYENFFYI